MKNCLWMLEVHHQGNAGHSPEWDSMEVLGILLCWIVIGLCNMFAICQANNIGLVNTLYYLHESQWLRNGEKSQVFHL